MTDVKAVVAAELEKFWAEQSISIEGSSESVDDLVAAMDSFTATEALERLEAIVGLELPVGKLIRAGGYDNKVQFVEQLSARVAHYVAERS